MRFSRPNEGRRALVLLLGAGMVIALGAVAAFGALAGDEPTDSGRPRNAAATPARAAAESVDTTEDVTVAAPELRGKVSALFVGDSLADLLAHAFVPELGITDLEVHTVARPGCGLSGGVIAPEGGTFGQQDCTDWVERWTYGLEVFEPDIVVLLTGTWEVFDRVIDGRTLSFDESADYYTGQLDKALALVQSHGVRLVVLSQPCNATAEHGSPYPFDERFEVFNERVKAWAEQHADGVTWIDLADYVCPLSKWDAQLDGEPFYPDDIHFSEQSADLVWDWLAPELVNAVPNVVDDVTDTADDTVQGLLPPVGR